MLRIIPDNAHGWGPGTGRTGMRNPAAASALKANPRLTRFARSLARGGVADVGVQRVAVVCLPVKSHQSA